MPLNERIITEWFLIGAHLIWQVITISILVSKGVNPKSSLMLFTMAKRFFYWAPQSINMPELGLQNRGVMLLIWSRAFDFESTRWKWWCRILVARQICYLFSGSRGDGHLNCIYVHLALSCIVRWFYDDQTEALAEINDDGWWYWSPVGIISGALCQDCSISRRIMFISAALLQIGLVISIVRSFVYADF